MQRGKVLGEMMRGFQAASPRPARLAVCGASTRPELSVFLLVVQRRFVPSAINVTEPKLVAIIRPKEAREEFIGIQSTGDAFLLRGIQRWHSCLKDKISATAAETLRSRSTPRLVSKSHFRRRLSWLDLKVLTGQTYSAMEVTMVKLPSLLIRDLLWL